MKNQITVIGIDIGTMPNVEQHNLEDAFVYSLANGPSDAPSHVVIGLPMQLGKIDTDQAQSDIGQLRSAVKKKTGAEKVATKTRPKGIWFDVAFDADGAQQRVEAALGVIYAGVDFIEASLFEKDGTAQPRLTDCAELGIRTMQRWGQRIAQQEGMDQADWELAAQHMWSSQVCGFIADLWGTDLSGISGIVIGGPFADRVYPAVAPLIAGKVIVAEQPEAAAARGLFKYGMALLREQFALTGYVYLFGDVGLGLYKIGISSDPERRLQEINSGNGSAKPPYEVVIVHSIHVTNPLRVERYLHQKFDHLRLKGEWFRLTSNEIAFIRRFNERDITEGNDVSI